MRSRRLTPGRLRLSEESVRPCQETDNGTRLLIFNALQEIASNCVQSGSFPCDDPPSPPAPEAQFFTAGTLGDGAFPNAFNKYAAAALLYHPGTIWVIRGQAPTIPDTRDGEPVTGPRNMRYWSMCNNDAAFPFPVVQCQPDFETGLDSQGQYTVVVSTVADKPGRAQTDPTVTWINWGCINGQDEQGQCKAEGSPVRKSLLLRNMLPDKGFCCSVQEATMEGCGVRTSQPDQAEYERSIQCTQQVMQSYYPVITLCSPQDFDAHRCP